MAVISPPSGVPERLRGRLDAAVRVVETRGYEVVVGACDREKVAAAEPTWVVGYSDMATLVIPLTLPAGTETLHGDHLMDTLYRAPEGLLSWPDIV